MEEYTANKIHLLNSLWKEISNIKRKKQGKTLHLFYGYDSQKNFL